jgi:hypothetical protein
MKMKKILYFNVWFTVCVIAILGSFQLYAGPIGLRNEKAVQDNAAAGSAGEATETGATFVGSMDEFKADRDTFLARVTAYKTDMSAATNAIAGTTGTTKTMGNKIQNEIDSLQKEILSLKQMIVDLKKAMIADKRGK